MARVRVVYVTGHLEGQERWLDKSSGLLFGGKASGSQLNSGFVKKGDFWQSGEDRVVIVDKDDSAPKLPTPDPKLDSASERGAGLKFDGGKPRWSLLMEGCNKALAGVAAVLTFGAKKYEAHSWKQVENNKERYRDAMYRHLNAIESGEVLDPESGLPHWDHVACNALFLSELNKESGNEPS